MAITRYVILSYLSLQIWNNIISLSFENDEFTATWRNTFTRDFEGKFQQVWTSSVCIEILHFY